MYKIRYYYSSLAKQFFIGSVVLAMLARLILFFVGNFYKDAYVGASVAFYVVVFIACGFFFTAYRFKYFEFDEETLTRHNLLTRTTAAFDLAPVDRALFSHSGISLFYEKDEKPSFFIPFRSFGIVSPVGVENFMNLMKNHGVKVEQDYKILPGYDEKSKWFGRGYGLLTLIILYNTFQYGLIIFLLLAEGK